MAKWYIIEIFVNFLQVYVIYNTYDLFFNRRFKFKHSVTLGVLFMTAVLSYLNFNISINSNPYFYLGYIFMLFLVSLILFKGKVFPKILTICMLIVVLGICELIAAALISSAAGLNLMSIQEQTFGRFEVMVISQTVFVYLYLLLKKNKYRKENSNLNNKYYLMVVAILILTVTVTVLLIWMYGNINVDNDNVNNKLVIMTLCVSLISIIAIVLTDRILKDMGEKHKNDLELQKMKLEHSYFSDVNTILEEIRILRHDLRGELAIIYGYNELNQREKISNHIEKKLKELDIQHMPQIDDENVLSAFLNFKFKEAKSNNITVDFKSNLSGDDEIYIDKEDICRILNNIMNNAIEACSKCEQKYVKLSINKYDDYIFIKSENPYKDKLQVDGKRILTIKSDKSMHGYGLKSVINIAEKFNGFVDINYDDSIFKVNVQMLNKENSNAFTLN
jgi:signal transduction histidine kinase